MMSQCWLIVGDSEWADSGWTWGPARSCDETCVLRARLSKLSRFKLELQVGSLPVSCASLASLSWAAFKLCPYTFYPEKCDKISPPFLPKFSPFLRPQVGIESVSKKANIFPDFFKLYQNFPPFQNSDTIYPRFLYLLYPVSDTIFIPISKHFLSMFPTPFLSLFQIHFSTPAPLPFLSPFPMPFLSPFQFSSSNNLLPCFCFCPFQSHYYSPSHALVYGLRGALSP